VRSFCHPQRRLLSAFILALALAAFAAGCGGDSSSDPTQVADTDATSTEALDKSERTEAVLHPVAEMKASGTVVAVREHGKYLIKIRIKGLKPAVEETMYVAWLKSSRHSMYALGAYRVRGDMRLDEDLIHPNAFLHLESGKSDFLLTRIDSDDVWRDSYSETDDPFDPAFIGRPILEGSFSGPLVEPG
jgi:hypothetical protein